MNSKNLMVKLIGTVLAVSVFQVAQAADISERKLKFGHLSTEESPLGQGANKFAELVATKSGNKIQIKVYHAGQLGGEVQQIGAAQGRTQDFVMLSNTPLSSIVKDLQILDFPGVIGSAKEADALLDGPVGQKMLAKFQDKNLVGLTFFENGFRHLTNNTRRVQNVSDISGLKVRVQQSPSSIDMFQRLGANAVPMSWNQLYTGLETRTVDGQENPIATFYTGKLNEVQKYMTLTGHAYGAHVLVASKRMWDSLSADEQQVMKEAMVEAREFQRKFNREQEKLLLDQMKANGLTVDEFTQTEKDKMMQAVKPVLDKYSAAIGADTVRDLLDERERIRKSM